MVEDIPRLSRMGVSVRPTSSSSAKFCMLRDPIWNMSVVPPTSSTWRGSRTSVTTGSPVAARASASSASPSSFSPRNE